MSILSQAVPRHRRLRDYGAFQTDISMLDTLTTTAIRQQGRLTESLPAEDVHNAGHAISRFPALTLPCRKPLQRGSSVRDALLLRVQKAIKHKWLRLIIRLCATGVLLAYLFKSISWQMMLTALMHVHPGNVLVGLVVGSSGVVLSAYQWRILLRAQHIQFDLVDLIKLYLIGITFSHFLPIGFGGDTFKCLYVGRESRNFVGATVATIVCRIAGFVGMLLLIFPVLIILHERFPFILTLSFMLLCLLGCAVIVGTLLFTLMFPALSKRKWAQKRFFTPAIDIGAALHKSVLIPRPMFGAVFCGSVFWLVAILNCYVYANAVGIHEQLTFYFLTVPLAAIVASLPISLNGFGVREDAFVYVLSFVHVAPVTALLLAFLLDLQALFFALLGSWIYFTLDSEQKMMLFGRMPSGRNHQ